MKRAFLAGWSAAAVVVMGVSLAARPVPIADVPLAVDSAKVTLAGTSNIHEYTASTTKVRVTQAQLGDALDKNMYKALKVDEFPDITFRLTKFDFTGKPAGAAKAIGVLKIAGVERQITMDITTKVDGEKLDVQGRLDLLMTDFGIKPPTAMMGMLKTDPKVTVTFETVLAMPLS
jgi:hypothetical protein